jgi:hypothetical protein
MNNFENNRYEHSKVERAVKSKANLIALVSIAALAMISAGTTRIVLADPAHCFGQECFNLGYQHGLANPGAPCPSGHSDNFCAGWNATSGGSISSDNNYSVTSCEYGWEKKPRQCVNLLHLFLRHKAPNGEGLQIWFQTTNKPTTDIS